MESWIDANPAFKLNVDDLTKLNKCNDMWYIQFGKEGPKRELHSVQIQVEVTRLSGMDNEIMLVSDGSGKAKVTRGSNVPGQFSWLKAGSNCTIVGSVIESGKIPHIQATKIANVDNKLQLEMWPLEVKELRNYLSGLVTPQIT